MKKITIIVVWTLFTMASFAQSNNFNIKNTKEYNDIYNTIESEVRKAASEALAKEKVKQAQNQPTQTQTIHSAQTSQQQVIHDYTNKINSEGQQRMEYYNNPDNYIDRSITNRGSTLIYSNNGLRPNNPQTRDIRTEPVHSENLQSKSLQMLREANREFFSSEDVETTINPNARVQLFDAPKLDDQRIGNTDDNNVQRYFDNSGALTKDFLGNPKELENLLKTRFEQMARCNLDAIRNKQPENRTEAENQALADYEAYRVKEMEQMNRDIEKQIDNSPEKKEIDAAILAWDSYNKDEEGWLGQTNYKKLDLEFLPNGDVSNEHQSILSVAEKIKECNKTQSETGFHAELYYNEATDAYVISFRGTDNWGGVETDYNIGKNAVLGTKDEIKQYEMAMEIAEVINKIPKEERDKLNIEVVGHSLGGGLASIVGLETGIDAKTFNAAMVPDNFLKEKGLYEKVNNGDVKNITAYHTSTDLLTNAQNSVLGVSAIGIPKDIGDPSTLMEKTEASLVGAVSAPVAVGVAGAVAGSATGAAVGDVVGTTVGNVFGETAGNVVGTIGTGAGAVAGAIAGGTAGVVVGVAVGPKLGTMKQGHSMALVTRHFFNSNTEKKKAEWGKLRNAQYQLQEEVRSAEIRRSF